MEEFNQRKRQFQSYEQSKGKRPMYCNAPDTPKLIQMIKRP